MEWHIITGEYPPQLGGVSDYTFQVSQEMAKSGDKVHVWSPATHLECVQPDAAEVHALPKGFGRRWLKELDWRLRSYAAPRNILIQYVPHMYGWKSMNLAFCWWIFRQRKHNVCVMFHEVAFPFRSGQPLRHHLLAMVHRDYGLGRSPLRSPLLHVYRPAPGFASDLGQPRDADEYVTDLQQYSDGNLSRC